MKDIRVVHDRVGCYADWFADDDNDCSIQEQWLVKYWDQYLTGKIKPNYPMPAIPFKVVFYASGDCIEIRSFKGIGSRKSYIDKVYWFK